MTEHVNPNSSSEPRSKTDFKAAFWVTVILVGLFIAALNFITAMSHSEEGAREGHQSEATTNEAPHGGSEAGTTADSSGHEGHY